MLIQIGQQLPPVRIGQHHIQYDEIGLVGGDGFKEVLAIGELGDLIGGIGRPAAIEIQQVGVVIDGQHGNSFGG